MEWPFGRKRSKRLADVTTAEPAKISLLTRIVSPSAVTSPVSGLRAAIIHLEVLERLAIAPNGRQDETVDSYESLGAVVLGDMVTLGDEDGSELVMVARRARIVPAQERRPGTPLASIPAEVASLVVKTSGRGVLCYRELLLCTGDSVRLKAYVEEARSVVADGYRSGTRISYVVRDDLGPVVLEEVFEPPPW